MFHIKGSHRRGGRSTKFVLSDRLIVYTKSRKQLLHRKYLLYETLCSRLPIFGCGNVKGIFPSESVQTFQGPRY